MRFSFVLLSLIFLGSAANANPEINVRRSSKVESRGVITLGDIADISEDVKADVEKIEIVELPANAIRNLTGFQISKILRKYLPSVETKIGEKIKTTVPPVVRVQNQAFKLSQETVAVKIEAELKKLCSDCEFTFGKINLPDLHGVSINAAWAIEYSAPRLPRGNFNLPLKIDGRTFWITGDVKVMRQAPVAIRNLNIGERLNETDFKVELRDVTFANDGLPENTKLIGRQISRGVSVNELITYANLAKEIAVKYGQSVKVLSENEWLQVSMNGIAQEKGDVGDRIKVLNPTTKTVLSAVIESPGIVRIQ